MWYSHKSPRFPGMMTVNRHHNLWWAVTEFCEQSRSFIALEIVPSYFVPIVQILHTNYFSKPIHIQTLVFCIIYPYRPWFEQPRQPRMLRIGLYQSCRKWLAFKASRHCSSKCEWEERTTELRTSKAITFKLFNSCALNSIPVFQRMNTNSFGCILKKSTFKHWVSPPVLWWRIEKPWFPLVLRVSVHYCFSQLGLRTCDRSAYTDIRSENVIEWIIFFFSYPHTSLQLIEWRNTSLLAWRF